MQNALRRMAAYSNPQYYKNLAMGFSTRDNPRIVACSEDFDDHICISRGLQEKLTELGVAMMEKPGMHEHFAVIDKEIGFLKEAPL